MGRQVTDKGVEYATDQGPGGAGVVGVQATGWLLQVAGPASLAGWWRACSAAAALCLAGSAYFLAAARGERLFGGETNY